MTQEEAKHLVAKRAVEFVEDGMAVGLGTGTTSKMFIDELGARARTERLNLRCVASSDASERQATALGLHVTSLADLPALDIYIDGADEVARNPGGGLVLIKGGGGALLREKIVASAAKKFIVVVDSTKIVEKLGKFPLPVEVIKMALPLVHKKLADLGLNPRQRKRPDGSDYITDENNYILDCMQARAGGVIDDPAEVAAKIRAVVGVVEHGIFLNMASLALIAGDAGVSEMHP